MRGALSQADMRDAINSSNLREEVYRDVSFGVAGQEVDVTLTNPYTDTPIPSDYKFKIVSGNRRANVRKSGKAWTATHAYFISNVSSVYADIVIIY